MSKRGNLERGQSLVILALGVVGLLGGAALAIDGGMIYAHRRRAQIAADTAALAAALAKTQGVDFVLAALNRAESNGFDDADPLTTVSVFNPPVIEPYKSDTDANQYIQVQITGQVNTAFLHFVFKGPVRNTVDAIARARPPVNLADGYALFGTSLTECDALSFGGNGKIKLAGGDAFSNSDGTAKVGSCSSGTRSGSGTVVLSGQTLLLVGDFVDSGTGGGVLNSEAGGSPKISEYVPQQQMPIMPVVPCPSTAKEPPLNINKSTTLSPGNYTSISVKAGAALTLNPGIYCMDGDFSGTGGSITGAGVLIKMLQGSFDLGGNSSVNLAAPTSGDWAGLLVYGEPATSLIKLTGGSGSAYVGTIYAPQTQCEIRGGSGTLAVNSQLICRTIQVVGDGTVDITYDPDQNYRLPTTLELAK